MKLQLVMQNKNKVDVTLLISISVQAIKHNGTPSASIKKETMEVTLQRGKGETMNQNKYLKKKKISTKKTNFCCLLKTCLCRS